MEHSLEHIVPDELQTNEITGSETLLLHTTRYKFAASHILPGITLDFACGSGYGSYLIASQADKNIEIIAADKNADIIKYANSRYNHPTIQFLVSDDRQIISHVPMLNNIVCLETIEHLPDPTSFIQSISGRLNTGGHFIASVPVTVSKDANPFHLHDFTISQFKSLFIKNNFKQLDELLQVQRFSIASVFMKKEKRMSSMRKNLMSYYLTHPSSFFKRIGSIINHGLVNKYYTGVFEKL